VSKHLVRIVLGCLLVLVMLGHTGHFWRLPFLSALDAYLYDARVRLAMSNTIDERVVIVDIDEKSLAQRGRWPWGRDEVAALIRKLTDDYRAAIVGFDVVFAEPDESSGLKVLEALGRRELKNEASYQALLGKLRKQLDYDGQLAATLRDRPVILGYYFTNAAQAGQAGALPAPVLEAAAFAGRQVAVVSWPGYGANLPVLQAQAAGAGHFNPMVDFDGSARRVPLVVEYQGAYYEALSLAMLRHLIGESTLQAGFPDDGPAIEWLDIESPSGRLRIPVDDNVAALVPYRGRERSFPYLSAVDVLDGKVSVEQLEGRIVLVGTSAPGLNDLRTTPVGAAYPGVEVHANLIAGMLSGSIKAKPGYVGAIDGLVVLVLGGLLALLLPLLSPFRASLLAVGALLGSVGFNLWLWQSANLVLPMAAWLLLILSLYALNMSWGYFVESRTKRQFSELFGQYVPPELVDQMAHDPESYSMDGRNEALTILFADIRGFTSLSEGMAPRELTQLMNEYLGAMTRIIQRQRGTLDKYIGDAIMAFWGAPVADPENARHAVLTALAMQAELQQLNESFVARGWPSLRIGIGINSGVVTVGDMGSPVRKAYTVMGDAVNLASRLEGATKVYGVGILIGQVTRQAFPEMACRELDIVRVKGKAEPVAIYEPLGLERDLTSEQQAALTAWHHFLRLYRACLWDDAELHLARLRAADTTRPLYALYAQRLQQLQDQPPAADWDGVTNFESK